MAGLHLHWVFPALFKPAMAAPSADSSAWKELRTLLARAERVRVTATTEALLCTLFGIDSAGQLSIAAVTHAFDAPEPGDAWWLRADPVYLRTDNGRVFMLGNDLLTIEPDEASALIQELRVLFDTHEWVLSAPHPKRWYLRLPRDPEVTFHSLSEAMGGDVHDYLPQDEHGGAQGKQWRGLLNEAQMLLYASPINDAREARGATPINSLWFWGGGSTPRKPTRRFVKVWSDEVLSLGLAKLSATPSAPVPTDARQWLAQAAAGEHLIMPNDNPISTQDDGRSMIDTLNEHWFAPLLTMLKARALDRLDIYAGNGAAFRLTPTAVSRWWKRPRPLAAYR